MASWTREEVTTAIREWREQPDRVPKVRCRIGTRNVHGRIIIDGNNPWVEVWDGEWRAERFGWSLVLSILNDRFAAPIQFDPLPTNDE